MNVPPNTPLPPPDSFPPPRPPSPPRPQWAAPGAPPPPPAAGNSRRTTAVVLVLLAALVLAGVAVVVVTRDGDEEETVASTTAATSVDTTDPPSTTIVDRATTTVRPSTTTRSATTTTPPAPVDVPPPAITTLSQALDPVDAASLRGTLDAYAFPAWWPLPDGFAARGERFSTVQKIGADDSLITLDVKSESSASWRTSWLDTNPDLAAVEAYWTGSVPRELFDVDEGIADKSTASQGGETTYTYYFQDLDPNSFESLSLDISDAVTVEGERLGFFIDFSFSGPYVENAVPPPVGAGPGKQFLGLAPTSSDMVWERTAFAVDDGAEYGFGPSGSYRASWTCRPEDFDRVITFLSDPANFTGGLQQVLPGRFESDDYWTQHVVYGDLAGEYSMTKPSPGDRADVYISLEFQLA